MSNVVARVQRMLESAGFARSTIALAAAKEGDFEVMGMLLAEFGPEVFDGGRNADPYVYASLGNRPDVMQWFADNGVLPDLDQHVNWREDLRSNARVVCYPAYAAAQEGALDALGYIAKKIPAVTQYPLRPYRMEAIVPAGHPWADRQGRLFLCGSDGSYGEPNFTYTGLLVTCAVVLKARGGSADAVLVRLREHLAGAPPIQWRDLDMALRFGQYDAALMLMEAGAKIDLSKFLQRLKQYEDPIGALRCIAEHTEKFGKDFSSMCSPHEASISSSKPPVFSSTVDELLVSEGGGFGHYVHEAVVAVRGMTTKGLEDKPKLSDAALVSAEMVRFMRNLDARFVGPAMLVQATSSYVPELVKTLLQSGVNPNEYQYCRPDKPGTTYVGPRMERRLAVHDAGEELLRLLVDHGADVNLPMWGTDENLLYILCTSKDIDPKMFYVFAECGGDFARKFGGKTAASVAKKKGEEIYGHFMAAKAHIAVFKGVGDQKASGPKRSPSTGMSPL
jgi:hypothetical protein